MTTEHLELARGAIDASEEVVATPEQMANAGVYRGHHGFLHMLEDWGDAWEDSASRRASPFAAGDGVVIPVRQYGRGRGSGIETAMSTHHVAHFREGRMVGWHLCETREAALAHAWASRLDEAAKLGHANGLAHCGLALAGLRPTRN